MERQKNYNATFEATFKEVLGEQEPNAETLKQLLTDCLFSFSSDPKNIIRVVNKIVLQEEIFAGLAGSKESIEDNTTAFAIIKENIRYFQRLNNISSLYTRHLAIRDHLFTCKDTAHELCTLDEDKVILKGEVARIAEYFFSLLDGYTLFEEDPNDDITPINMQNFQNTIASADYACITSQSQIWEQVSDKEWHGHNCVKPEPDKIRLYLETWYYTAYYPEFCAVGLHPSITPSEIAQS